MRKETRIVVVGGGAGGLELMARLGRRFGRERRYDAIRLERNRTHVWKPLLHEMASGAQAGAPRASSTSRSTAGTCSRSSARCAGWR